VRDEAESVGEGELVRHGLLSWFPWESLAIPGGDGETWSPPDVKDSTGRLVESKTGVFTDEDGLYPESLRRSHSFAVT
jgi:hypothetical protein